MTNQLLRLTLLLCILLIFAGVCSRFSDADDAVGRVSFRNDIRPILSDKCCQCHGPDGESRGSDLRLDRFESDEDSRGAESVLDGGVQSSELIRRIFSADVDERMPPATSKRQLEPKERGLLKRWVEQGAEFESHWSFITPVRPPLPKVKDSRWPRNGIDHFVLARLESEGMTPSPQASIQSIARRLSLDLIGLPPDSAIVDTIHDERRYEQWVGELLESPRYGEHWATMWLDAARYADTNGYNNDTPRYNWRYRDWVIDALNRNLPYDAFVTEQLAGDLIPEATVDQQIASGFNRNHNVTSEGGIVDEEYRLEYVADRVDTTATTFMALTVGCARCHDHKFDPVSQREYYQLFAFFNQVPEQGYHEEHVGNPKPVIRLADSNAELAALETELAECNKQLAAKVASLEGHDANEDADFKRLSELKDSLTKKHRKLENDLPSAMVMRDKQEPRMTFILNRGAYDQPADQVEADVPALFPRFPADAPRNRLGLSRWLVSDQHPLTARVVVNRIWAELFGFGLVPTPEDFGTQGTPPSHPELLDWLAVELMESGWDLHHLLRLIVSSATYQQAAVLTPELIELDPDNRLLGRAPRFRMKAEVIRDSALSVSGLLVHKVGGPSVRPYQPDGLWAEVSVTDDSYSGGPYVQSHGDDLYRRSLYSWWKRTCPPPSLNLLDAPEREFCRVQRSRTNTPLQALVLLNDPTFVEAARKLAERMLTEGGQHPRTRLAYGFRLAIGRQPSDVELDVFTVALERYLKRFKADSFAAARLLSVGESDLPALDQAELAAYAAIASTLLNLDEFVTK